MSYLPGVTRWRGGSRATVALHCRTEHGIFAKENLVKAKVGKIIHLPCCHELPSPESQYNYRVYWQTEKEVVMAYSAGKLVRTDAKFVNRTKMDLQNLTMSIFPVKLSDTDTYKCIVQVIEKGPSKLCDRTVDLVVEADFSKPVISADVPKDACGSTEVTVNCYSHGGFPAPRVSGILNNMSVDWQTNLSDSKDSLYNVTAKLQLNLTEDIFLTCTIEYDDFEVSSNYILSNYTNIKLASPLLPASRSITGCNNQEEIPASHTQ
uniref:Ig-like domain-containing protein n=1 Tax=Terrapene triunguis TaxID=2587831 RepID=A0A674I7Q1_9SAUR